MRRVKKCETCGEYIVELLKIRTVFRFIAPRSLHQELELLASSVPEVIQTQHLVLQNFLGWLVS